MISMSHLPSETFWSAAKVDVSIQYAIQAPSDRILVWSPHPSQSGPASYHSAQL